MSEPLLKPGDVLLYAGGSVWSWFIKVKTWSPISHVEVYIGDGKAVASRDGQGVNCYAFTTKNLHSVMRALEGVDLRGGLAWFKEVRGRKYDWWGLARFFRIGKYTDKKMFCSEFAVNFLRRCGFDAFNADFAPDQVSPGMFLASPHLVTVWRRDIE